MKRSRFPVPALKRRHAVPRRGYVLLRHMWLFVKPRALAILARREFLASNADTAILRDSSHSSVS